MQTSNSSKQDILTIVVIIILVIGLGYFVWNYNMNKALNSTPTNVDETTIVEVVQVEVATCGDQCKYENALAKRDLTLCSEIEQTDFKESCIASISKQDIMARAVTEDSVLICDEFAPEFRTNCYDNFYYVKKLKTGDKKYCESIFDTQTRDECSN